MAKKAAWKAKADLGGGGQNVTAPETHLRPPSTKAAERIAEDPGHTESREGSRESPKPEQRQPKKRGRPITDGPKSKRADYQREKMRQLRLQHPEKYRRKAKGKQS